MNLRSLTRLAALVFVLSGFAAGTGLAQGTQISMGVRDHDTGSPVEITSKELEVDQEAGTATFTGDVIVGQGDIILTNQRMVVEYGPDENGDNEIKVIRMFGGVTFVSEEEAAESDSAVYTLATDTIVMLGDVLVTQGTAALSSDKLTYNLKSGDGVMEGRVKTILQPGNN